METSGSCASPWLLRILSAALSSARFTATRSAADEQAAEYHDDDQQYAQCTHRTASPTPGPDHGRVRAGPLPALQRSLDDTVRETGATAAGAGCASGGRRSTLTDLRYGRGSSAQRPAQDVDRGRGGRQRQGHARRHVDEAGRVVVAGHPQADQGAAAGRQAQQRAGRSRGRSAAPAAMPAPAAASSATADGGGRRQRQRAGQDGHRDRGRADRHGVRVGREMPGRDDRERGRGRPAAISAVHPLVGAARLRSWRTRTSSTHTPSVPMIAGGRVLPAGGEQRGVGGQPAREGERDALPGGPHAVQPEPAGGGDGLEQRQRHERAPGAPSGAVTASSRPSAAVSAAGWIPGVDDRRAALGAGALVGRVSGAVGDRRGGPRRGRAAARRARGWPAGAAAGVRLAAGVRSGAGWAAARSPRCAACRSRPAP